MSEFSIYRRWNRLSTVEEIDVIQLVERKIVPAYEQLDDCTHLDLLRVGDGRSYLAVQYWIDKGRWQKTLHSPEYAEWLKAYEPILKTWHQYMEFVEEWEAVNLLRSG